MVLIRVLLPASLVVLPPSPLPTAGWSPAGSFRNLDLFCWGIFLLSVLVLDGHQLRDTQPRVDPCGFG